MTLKTVIITMILGLTLTDSLQAMQKEESKGLPIAATSNQLLAQHIALASDNEQRQLWQNIAALPAPLQRHIGKLFLQTEQAKEAERVQTLLRKGWSHAMN